MPSLAGKSPHDKADGAAHIKDARVKRLRFFKLPDDRWTKGCLIFYGIGVTISFRSVTKRGDDGFNTGMPA
jgi:hypothetical protein